jgi:hypothetical protein
MSIGTGAAIALGIGAAASLGSAAISAHAAGKASDQQQQASKDALAAQGPLYQQALAIAQQQAQQGQARLDPYAQQGGAGLTALTSFLGVPVPKAPNPAQGLSAGTGGFGPGQQTYGAGSMLGQLATGQAVPPPGGTVLLRAPNGQTQAVPADHADYYVARGATRV